MPDRYLSVQETALELGIGEIQVKRLLEQKVLVGFRMPDRGRTWRILDPAPALRRQLKEPRLIDVCIITRAELAEITGLSIDLLKWHCRDGNLKGSINSGLMMHSVRQVRDFIAYYDDRKGRSKHSYNSIIVDWLKRYLDEAKPNGEIIDRLIREAVVMPEPARSQLVFKLWNLFDQVNDLLKECQKR